MPGQPTRRTLGDYLRPFGATIHLSIPAWEDGEIEWTTSRNERGQLVLTGTPRLPGGKYLIADLIAEES